MRHAPSPLAWIALALFATLMWLTATAQAGTVTPAGNGTLSADTAANGGNGGWTTLSGPTYAETINGDLNNGTVTLNIPAGFELRTGVPVSVVLISGASNASTNMNGAAVGGNVASTSDGSLAVTATTITFTINSKSRGNVLNTIEWRGVQVRPLNGFPLASGNITASGTSGIATVANSSNFGTLTTVNGAMVRLLTGLPGQSFIAGTGFTGTPINQTAGTAFALAGLVATDRFFNPITSYNGTKSISYSGPSSSCSSAPSYTTSVNFSNGISTTTLNTTLRKAETTTITASDGTVSGPASASVTVNTGTASRLIVTLPGQSFVPCRGSQGTPDDQTAGISFVLPAITATDASFNIVTSYAGNKTLSYSGPSGSASYTTNVSFVSGQSTTMLVTSIANAQTTSLSVSDGSISGPSSSSFLVKLPPISSFNAFDSATPAGATSGNIKTKIAGNAFALDIVALSGMSGTSTLATSYTGSVKVELVDGSGSTACALRSVIQSLPNQTFVQSDQGRRTISGITVPNAWRNVSVRISTPVLLPLVVVCSSDNFAIRPASFGSLAVTDQDPETAGTARILNNTALNAGATGAIVHKAGRPFTIKANAVSGSGATTTNYSGTPTTLLSQCAPVSNACPAAASLGALSVGSWTNSAGALSTSSATYSEVGAFGLVLQDQQFADIDALDSSLSERTISSASINVGRFVPDHFTVVPLAITPRSDLACPSATFTYMNEPFQVRFELYAKNASEATTVNYAGTLATLDPANASHLQFGAINGSATGTTAATALVAPITAITRANPGKVTTGRPHGLSTGARVFISGVSSMNGINNTLYTVTVVDATSFTIGIDTSSLASYVSGGHVSRLAVTASAGSWMAGKATVTSTLTLQRTVAPDGPFNSVRLGIAPQDADGVQSLSSSLNLDADASGSSERVSLGLTKLLFGRLWIGNALGSERFDLSLPLQAQAWTANGFLVNAADNCTSIASAGHVLLTNPLGGISTANMKSPDNVRLGATFNAGLGRLTLTKQQPTPTTKGSVDVAIDLGAEGKTYLQTNGASGIYNQNPKARATFGVSRSEAVMYRRELF